ncbi:D-alanine--D-alanine ligase family protein [Agrobacterium pusense]|uniref:D-alanine--D-alanine ligase family protein n=1 Tax=Agrobacterium pusense TaxID=648995 RepID=UPI003FD57964
MQTAVIKRSRHQLSLLFGGASAEHDVSVESFRFVLEEIRQSALLSPVLIGYMDDRSGVRLNPFHKNFSLEDYMVRGDSLHVFDALRYLGSASAPIFNLLIGRFGEDGKLQGAARLAGLEGSFGDVLPNALAMSKIHMNTFVEGCRLDLSIPRSCPLHFQASENALLKLRDRLETDDVIIKPNSSGSSILTERVNLSTLTEGRLASILQEIFFHDMTALAQEFVSGREFTVGCFASGGQIIPLPVVEIRTRGGFFSNENKYLPGAAEENFLDDGDPVANQLRSLSVELFERMGMLKACRFDYILKNDNVFFLEANTIPGMTVNSIFPKMIRRSGRSIAEYIFASLSDSNKSVNLSE